MSINEEMHMQIDDYLNGRLDKDQRAQLELQISEQPELGEEVKIHRDLMAIVGEQAGFAAEINRDSVLFTETKQALSTKDASNLRKAILEVNSAYQRKKQSKSRSLLERIPLMAIAASVILLMVLGIIFWQNTVEEGLYMQYKDRISPISMIERSTSDDELKTMYNLFETEDYQGVIRSITTTPNLVDNHSEALLYLGLAYRETAQYQQAIASFERYGTVNDLDQSIADWHIGLIYLKLEDLDKAKTYFQKLSQDSGFEANESVKAILESLE
ncbi:MAG: tetratricopeptide repeat protein [Bacteroidota bacterium]